MHAVPCRWAAVPLTPAVEQGGYATTDGQRQILFIVQETPYGSERSYNGLRLAKHLSEQDGVAVRVFLTGDGVLCAKAGQRPSAGGYNVGDLVTAIAARGDVAT